MVAGRGGRSGEEARGGSKGEEMGRSAFERGRQQRRVGVALLSPETKSTTFFFLFWCMTLPTPPLPHTHIHTDIYTHSTQIPCVTLPTTPPLLALSGLGGL